MDYDLKIVDGVIVDGLGNPRYRGDVAVRNGVIAALGKVGGSARQTIRAEGCVIAPGFIDIHTHYDAQVFWDRMLSISPWHGVTTVIMGNCGFGIAPTRPQHRELVIQSLERVEGMDAASLRAGLGDPWQFETFADYMSAIDRRGVAVNVAVLAGHTPTRFYVMGEAAIERAASTEEIERMCALLRDALKAGAVGFATSFGEVHVGYGGRPVASRFADYAEVEALTGVLAEFPDAVFSPNAGDKLDVGRLTEIARATGANVIWNPLVSDLVTHVGNHRDELAQSAAAMANGQTVVPQISARPMVFEYQWRAPLQFEGLRAFRSTAVAKEEDRLRAFADPGFRSMLREDVDAKPELFQRSVGHTTVHETGDAAMDGKTLGELAASRGIKPVEMALDIAIRTKLDARFRMPLGNYREEEMRHLLTHPNTVIGLSDAGAHASQLCDACFPTYILAHWVRDKQVIELERAVQMLTSRPADLHHLKGRGRLAVGAAADIVVFNPDTVTHGPMRRVWDLPAKGNRLVVDAVGIEAVIVNGTVIRQGGADALDVTGDLPGKLIRRGA